jgi:hypothetical protein
MRSQPRRPQYEIFVSSSDKNLYRAGWWLSYFYSGSPRYLCRPRHRLYGVFSVFFSRFSRKMTGKCFRLPAIPLRKQFFTILGHTDIDAEIVIKWTVKGNERYVEKIKWSIKVLMSVCKLCKVSAPLVSPFALRISAHTPLHHTWRSSAKKNCHWFPPLFSLSCAVIFHEELTIFETILLHIDTPCSIKHLKHRRVVQVVKKFYALLIETKHTFPSTRPTAVNLLKSTEFFLMLPPITIVLISSLRLIRPNIFIEFLVSPYATYNHNIHKMAQKALNSKHSYKQQCWGLKLFTLVGVTCTRFELRIERGWSHFE